MLNGSQQGRNGTMPAALAEGMRASRLAPEKAAVEGSQYHIHVPLRDRWASS